MNWFCWDGKKNQNAKRNLCVLLNLMADRMWWCNSFFSCYSSLCDWYVWFFDTRNHLVFFSSFVCLLVYYMFISMEFWAFGEWWMIIMIEWPIWMIMMKMMMICMWFSLFVIRLVFGNILNEPSQFFVARAHQSMWLIGYSCLGVDMKIDVKIAFE